jgi:hypothetical protein
LACAADQSRQEDNRLGRHPARGVGHLRGRLKSGRVWMNGVRCASKRLFSRIRLQLKSRWCGTAYEGLTRHLRLRRAGFSESA